MARNKRGSHVWTLVLEPGPPPLVRFVPPDERAALGVGQCVDTLRSQERAWESALMTLLDLARQAASNRHRALKAATRQEKPPGDDWMTALQAARYLGISTRRIERLRRRGMGWQAPGNKTAPIYYRREDIDAHADELRGRPA